VATELGGITHGRFKSPALCNVDGTKRYASCTSCAIQRNCATWVSKFWLGATPGALVDRRHVKIVGNRMAHVIWLVLALGHRDRLVEHVLLIFDSAVY
jgi:hypothetical protein